MRADTFDGVWVDPSTDQTKFQLKSVAGRLTTLSLVLAAGLAMGALVAMTTWGIGMSPDGVAYIRQAREIASDFSPSQSDAAHFAPLYPWILAATSRLADPIVSARWLNVLLLGGNVLLVGFLVRVATLRDPVFPLVAALMMCSAVVISAHALALSEPLFLFLSFAGLGWLGVYFDRRSGRIPFLIAAAVALGLALLARYAGIAGIVTGTFAVLFSSRIPRKTRFVHSIVFAGIAVAPLLLYLGGNLARGGAGTGRRLMFHPLEVSQAWQAVYTITSWLLLPPEILGMPRLIALFVLLSCCCIGWMLSASVFGVVRIVRLYGLTYAAFLVVSVSLFDANTPFDDRILLPVFAAGLIVVLQALHHMTQRRTWLRLIGYAGLLVFVAAHVSKASTIVVSGYSMGWGFSSRAWRESQTLEKLHSFRNDLRIYSNAPEIIYLHTNREALPLPKQRFLTQRRANPDFGIELAAVKRKLAESCGLVVFFRHLPNQKAVPAEQEVKTKLDLRVSSTHADGVILTPQSCQE